MSPALRRRSPADRASHDLLVSIAATRGAAAATTSESNITTAFSDIHAEIPVATDGFDAPVLDGAPVIVDGGGCDLNEDGSAKRIWISG